MEKKMLPKLEFGNPDENDSNNGHLLRDIEEISKALYLKKNPKNVLISSSNFGFRSAEKSHLDGFRSSPSLSSSSSLVDDKWLPKEKKQSIWTWKPLKALSHIRHKKFSCSFFCHVHSIQNLPSDFDGLSMSVHWKKGDILKTLPMKVANGLAEFEETLMKICTVYGTKNGPKNFVKYDPKLFLLYPSVIGAGEFDIGKHWIDLTRLLPLTIDELEEDRCSGKWSTSFKLAGEAKGAILHVSFGFVVLKDGVFELRNDVKLLRFVNSKSNEFSTSNGDTNSIYGKRNSSLRRVGSVPSRLHNASLDTSQCLDVKTLPQGWLNRSCDFSSAVDLLYRKLEQENIGGAVKLDSCKLVSDSFRSSLKDVVVNESDDDDDFTVIEDGVELECSSKEELKLEQSSVSGLDVSSVEVIDIKQIFKDEGVASDEETKLNVKGSVAGGYMNDSQTNNHGYVCKMESNMEESVLDFHDMIISELSELELPMDECEFIRNKIPEDLEINSQGITMARSLSLNDRENAVADEFLRLVLHDNSPSPSSPNSDSESPRERLLKEFEKDVIANGSFPFDCDAQAEAESESDHTVSGVSFSKDFFMGVELSPILLSEQSANPPSKTKTKAKMLERLETQSLMQRWGLNEDAFQRSPKNATGGFGSPIFVPLSEPMELPPLGEGLGSLLSTKDGGLLRSMSSRLFRNAKNGGTLIMQASKPVVLPAQMGSCVMEILQCMASTGVEQLSEQVKKLMPLQEVSGKIVQQLVLEGSTGVNLSERSPFPWHEGDIKSESKGSSHVPSCSNADSSSSCTDKQEQYKSIKDLTPFVMDNIEVLLIEGLRIQSDTSDLEAPSSINLNSISRVQRIMDSDTSLEPDVSSNGDRIETLMDLSISLDEWLRLDSGDFDGEDNIGDRIVKVLAAHHGKTSVSSNRNFTGDKDGENESGLLGNELTIALRMQLRDPHRNYELVGAPMLAFIVVERLYIEENQCKCPETQDEIATKRINSFKIHEAHVAGLNSGPTNGDFWATQRQQQSGSRWLLASGMNQNSSCQNSNSKAISRLSSKVLRKSRYGHRLWSISSGFNGAGAEWNNSIEHEALIRNPDIVYF